MMAAYQVLLLNTAIPQIQAAQSGDTYVVPRDIAFSTQTQNGVPYFSGAAKTLTSGSALTFDGTYFTVGASSTTGDYKAFIQKAGGELLGLNASSGTLARIAFGNATASFGSTQIIANGADLAFITNSAEQMRLTSTGLEIKQSQLIGYSSYAGIGSNGLAVAGNVGIGTDTPGSKIHGAVAANGIPILTLQNTSTSQSSYGILFDTELNNAGSRNWALISEYAAAGDFHIVRSNAKDGNPFSAGTSVLALDSSGNLLVGTTDSSQGSGNGNKLLAGGAVYVVNAATSDGFSYYNSSASAYRFYVSSGGTISATNTTISAISDIRFKENIRDLDVGLDAIMALKPRLYDWKEGKGANIKNARGFIAQEFEQVFPDLIDEWKDPAPEGEDPYKSVRADLMPVLVKAIQELTARVAALEAN